MSTSSKYLAERMERSNAYCSMQIVFVDIVSYSKRRSHAQVGVIGKFMEAIESALKATAKHFVEDLQRIDVHLRPNIVLLPLGDGALIGFPFDAVPSMHMYFIASLLSIADGANRNFTCEHFTDEGWCDCHHGFLLRSGVSEGKLILYRDLNANFNVAGDPVNMAARVMALADANQVFFTAEAFNQIVELVPNTDRNFRKYRQAQIKHGLRIDVYQWVDETMQGLDLTPHIGLGLVDDSVEPDEMVTPVGPVVRTLDEAYGASPPPVNDINTAISDLKARMITILSGQIAYTDTRYGYCTVRLSRSLAVDPYLVTQQLYSTVMGRNPSRFFGERLPVESVSWLDAVVFCNRLSEFAQLDPVYEVIGNEVTINVAARGFRLPTEAEWEYFCRANVDEAELKPISVTAWYSGNSGGQPHPVGEKLPNAWGLFDTLGNVWEWCNDWYLRRYPEGFHQDYEGPETGVEKVLRGGSWSDLPDCIKSSFRHRRDVLTRDSTHGLRVVRHV
jgi:sulfatase modifying factor 1